MYQQLSWNEIRLEYSQKLLNMFLAGHPNHQLVFMRIWQIQPTYLTNAFRDFYEDSPLNITRILDVAQDLKVNAPVKHRSLLLTIFPDFGCSVRCPAFRFCA